MTSLRKHTLNKSDLQLVLKKCSNLQAFLGMANTNQAESVKARVKASAQSYDLQFKPSSNEPQMRIAERNDDALGSPSALVRHLVWKP